MDEMHGNLIPHDNVTSQEYSHEAEKNMFTTFTLQTEAMQMDTSQENILQDSLSEYTGCLEINIPEIEKNQATTCILHVGRPTQTKLFSFSEKTFTRVRECCLARIKMKRSKFSEVIKQMPDIPSKNQGYHYECYKSFTAVKKARIIDNITSQYETCAPEEDVGRCSELNADLNTDFLDDMQHAESTIEKVSDKLCVFCDCKNNVYKYEKQNLVQYKENEKATFAQQAQVLKDTDFEKKLLESETVYGHPSCRSKFSTKYKNFISKYRKEKTDWHTSREIHSTAWKSLEKYVRIKIIDKEEILTISELYSLYGSLLKENCNYNHLTDTYTFEMFVRKLVQAFQGNVKFGKAKSRKDNIVYSSNMVFDETVAQTLYDSKQSEDLKYQARITGDKLRKEILNHDYHKFEDIESVLRAKRDAPFALTEFFESLIGGPKYRVGCLENSRNKSEKCSAKQIYINSLIDDTMFTVTHGRILPAKHIVLGLALKSMTGSRKLMQIFNRYGHIINYDKAREIETDLADAIITADKDVPINLVKQNNLATCTVFDNYDEITETPSGSGTLHDTVGICFQNITTDASFSDSLKIGKKRQRSLQIDSPQLEPYYKKSRIQITIPLNTTMLEAPLSLNDALFRDVSWAWMLAFQVQNTPMWIGFNALTVKDERTKQTINYLKNYDSHSTNPSTIIETLKVTKRIMAECKEKYCLVYYDLAMAKPAMQIQASESPLFDDIFINFGTFHIFMAYFSAIGKIINESGISYYLTETAALAPGSVNGFLSGKKYNRCKRLHVLMSVAFQKLHIMEFIKSEGMTERDIDTDCLQNILNENKNSDQPVNELKELIKKYTEYCDATRRGDHGLTAQFYHMYIDLVQIYLLLSRAVRMCNIDLFIHCLPMMIEIFFSTNHQNYARYLVLYHQKLRNMDTTHPGLKEIFLNGGLSVKRTDKPFSGTPPDMTLEQTINKDAASRLSGIASFTNSYSARVRWTVTRSIRAQLVTECLKRVGLQRNEDVTSELQKSNIQRDRQTYDDLVNFASSVINPFSPELPRHKLFNIATGKPANLETANYLLNVRDNGKQLRMKFEQECSKNELRFENPISRQKNLTFASEGKILKVRTKNGEEAIKMTCGLFGRLCFLSINHGIDISLVLKYPLTPVPLSLAHIDGTLKKTEKAQLLKHLEKKCDSCFPLTTDFYIVDGGCLLFSIPDKPFSTLGDISQFILKYIIAQSKSKQIDVVFDTYKSPSIKDFERSRRSGLLSDQSLDVVIRGRDQRCPRFFRKAILNKKFTEQFIRFLVNDWKLATNLIHLRDYTLRVAYDSSCEIYTQQGSNSATELQCTFEEADTRMFYHCWKYSQEVENIKNKTIVVRTGDTDVLIIFLANLKFTDIKELWLDFGSGSNRRFINVTEIARNIGSALCDSLPGFHAFTGSDYTSAFSRKGKVRPYTIMEQDKEYQIAFANLGNTENVSDETFLTLSRYVSHLYGVKNTNSVDETRLQIFNKQFRANAKDPFKNLKNVDASIFPPCEKTLTQKVLRANYVAMMWKRCTDGCYSLPSPLNCGWKLEGNLYMPLWFHGECVPSNIDYIRTEYDDESDMDCDDEDTDTSEISLDNSESDN